MAAKAIQLYSGADSVRAAEQLRKAIQERRDSWPYVHVYPPPNSSDVFVIGTVPVPIAPAALLVQVLQYQVQSGKKFYQTGVIFGEIGNAFNPGDATFTEDRNSAIGSANFQFLPEHGLVNVPVLLGGQANGSYIEPFVFARTREFEPLDVIRIKATNVNLTGGTFVAGIFGYEVPVVDIPRNR